MSFSQEKLHHIWQETLKIIKKQVHTKSFETWFLDTKAISLDENNLIIETPNHFIKDWLEKRYISPLQEIIYNFIEKEVNILFLTPEELEKEFKKEKKININQQDQYKRYNRVDLNAKYTFDTFVVGSSNRFAHAASLAVAESPANTYNPFFIYGDVGLGKTHLMQAIAHFILDHNPNNKVVYVSSETFTNEIVSAIKNEDTVDFRKKYRNIDILLVDDIQFLAEKERTQEEFFHTFNALHEANKQVIISSDRPPKEIPTLEDRLRSRFEWGLITDIQKPDLETRMAILQKKAELENIYVPNEIITYIATEIKANIRELEGALNKVNAVSNLVNKEIDIELAKEAIKEFIEKNNPEHNINIDFIKKCICTYYNINAAEIESKKRTQDITFPRQIAMYMCRELTNASLPQIGKEFGNRDHTTVIHAKNKIEEKTKTDPDFKETIENIIQKIKTNKI